MKQVNVCHKVFRYYEQTADAIFGDQNLKIEGQKYDYLQLSIAELVSQIYELLI